MLKELKYNLFILKKQTPVFLGERNYQGNISFLLANNQVFINLPSNAVFTL